MQDILGSRRHSETYRIATGGLINAPIWNTLLITAPDARRQNETLVLLLDFLIRTLLLPYLGNELGLTC